MIHVYKTQEAKPMEIRAVQQVNVTRNRAPSKALVVDRK